MGHRIKYRIKFYFHFYMLGVYIDAFYMKTGYNSNYVKFSINISIDLEIENIRKLELCWQKLWKTLIRVVRKIVRFDMEPVKYITSYILFFFVGIMYCLWSYFILSFFVYYKNESITQDFFFFIFSCGRIY